MKHPNFQCSECHGRDLEEIDAVASDDEAEVEFYCFECGARTQAKLPIEAYREFFGDITST